MIKKVSAILLILAIAFTFSGCKVFSYWDGMTKSQVKEYICKELEEKYGEEFTVIETYKTGTGYLLADCSPKSNDNIVFDIQTFTVGNSHIMRDTYIQSIVRSEMLDIINSVLSEYSEKYAADVNVQGLYDEYDSGIREAKNATIKNYSETLPDTNVTDIWIALNDEKNIFRDNIQLIVEKITTDFFYTHALVHFYYVTDDIVQQCINETKNNRPTDRLVFYRILYGHYPCDAFNYNGKDGTLSIIEH